MELFINGLTSRGSITKANERKLKETLWFFGDGIEPEKETDDLNLSNLIIYLIRLFRN